jgi:hypothetical protein
MAVSFAQTIRRLLAASFPAAEARRTAESDDARAAAEIALLRDEVRRLQAVVEAVVVVFAQELNSSDADIERRLLKAVESARKRNAEADETDPVVMRASPFRDAVPVDPNSCARCGAPLGDDSSAFVPNVGSVCTACYRVDDAR